MLARGILAVVFVSMTGCLFAPSFQGEGNGGDGGTDDGGTGDSGAWIGTVMQTAYVKAQSVEVNDHAGEAVALSGDGTTLVFGVPYADVGGLADAGRVYVYVQNAGTWEYQETLISSPEPQDWFGSSLALSQDGNWLAVGAWGDDGPGNATGAESGAVHMFFRSGTTWGLVEVLRAPAADAGDQFGKSIAMSSDGTALLVGAPFEDSVSPTVQTNNDASAAGAAYLFTREITAMSWSNVPPTYLKSPVVVAGDQFGFAVAISGDGATLAVGAIGDDGTPAATFMESGAVHVLSRVGSVVQTLRASNPGINHSFGRTVALSQDGDTLLVGAPSEATAQGARVGAAYVFRRDGMWSEIQRLVAPNPDESDQLGTGLALSRDGRTALLGSPWESSSAIGIDGDPYANDAQHAGAAYLFTTDPTMQRRAYIKASNTQASAVFGAAVAISDDGTTFVVGAPDEDGGSTGVNGDQSPTSSDTGAVYVFQVVP